MLESNVKQQKTNIKQDTYKINNSITFIRLLTKYSQVDLLQ